MNTDNGNYMVFYPLTHPQKRIWFLEKIYPGTSLYNIGGTVRIKSNIDFGLLEKSINIFIKRNEGVRLSFVENSGEVSQYIVDYGKVKLDFFDFSKYDNSEEEFIKWVEIEAKRPFVLENERLFYFALFKLSDNDNGYLVKLHHIISDGWSTNIMTDQICDTYIRLLNEEQINDSLECSYIEYISNEKKYLLSDRFIKNKFFWNEKFKVLPDMSLNKSSDEIEGKRKTYELDIDNSNKLKNFVGNYKFSVNTFYVALFIIYLYKTTQQEDIVIGTPVFNRSGKKEKSTIGMFTSTMPFRFVIDDDLSIEYTMAKINEQLKDCYYNQKYPYDLLVKDLELKKKGYDNLFNTCVNYYNTRHNLELNNYQIENIEFYNGNQIYSLQLVIKDWSAAGNLTLEFDYKTNDYSEEQIDVMYTRLLNLTNQIIVNPYEKVKNLSILTYDERNKILYGFNDTKKEYPKNKMIYQLFEEQAKKSPDKEAIRFNDNKLTYQELNQKINQLARYLRNKGIKNETIVGLMTTHSIETVIGVFGILKAGGAYLPIDPDYPNDRICYMLDDSGASMILTNVDLDSTMNFNGKIIKLNNQNIFFGDASNLDVINKPDDLAYIIYTSGSTGKPKGSMIEHQSLVNYVWWAKKMYMRNEDEVIPLYSSLAFDLTVTTIFTPLISGSKIIVYSNNFDDEEYVLYKIIKENNITLIKLTPSHLTLLRDLDNSNSSVRRFIVGGEDLKVNIARDIYKSFDGKIEIFNEYGPTETVVGCMIHKYNCENDTRISVPIGVPAENVQIYILDKNLNPVPSNTIGEIYISGDGVARGYLNRSELTQEKFIDNPFICGRRMYKTGDLARFLNDGKIEYVGRLDQQVKIRGYRIELCEIEKHLLSHKSIKDVVVVDYQDNNNNKYLCAYIVIKSNVLISELKDFLRCYLPDYMIPSYFIELDEIPLTINGKINRALLPEPWIEEVEDTEFIVYRNENEENLIRVICEVLNIDRVSMRHNFYHIGGDSIKAIQIASKLNDRGLKIRVRDILSNPIIEEMAQYIGQSKELVIPQGFSDGTFNYTPMVCWFFSQQFNNFNHYNQSILLELNQKIGYEMLDIVFNELIKHHDTLRINCNLQTRELFYNNEHLNKYHHIQEYDLRNQIYSVQAESMKRIADDLKSSFNIENGILIKGCIFDLGQSTKRILITAHHLVVDGVSWRIILEDINLMLNQLNNGIKIILPSKTNSYQEWANRLVNSIKKEAQYEISYWQNALNQNFCFPKDYDLGEDIIDSCYTIEFKMSEEFTLNLMTKANMAYNTEPKDLLITSLLRTIKNFTGNEEIVIELEGHGRNDILGSIDISRTVGWFTSLFPFFIKLKKEDISSQIKEVKEEIRKIPNKGIDFGILKYLTTTFNESKNKHIRFNFLGDFTPGYSDAFFTLLNDQLGSDYCSLNTLTYSIEINCFVLNDRLNVHLTYSKNKYSENTMEKFTSDYMNNLENIIKHCCNKKASEYTPSDFDTVNLNLEELGRIFS